MANNRTYKVNTIGHWQGIEDWLMTISAKLGDTAPGESSENIAEDVQVIVEDQTSAIMTELQKLENGQTSAAQQLTELETLITATNAKLDSILTALNQIVANTSGTVQG